MQKGIAPRRRIAYHSRERPKHMTTIQHTLFDLSLPSRSLAERPMREWPIGERPVERLSAVGTAAVSDAELLAVLFSGSGGANPVALAQQLISTFGGWHEIGRASCRERVCSAVVAVPAQNRS